MNTLTITLEELSALSGLPHLQQLLYLRGIRPYVDYQTGIVGLKRGVSYQSFAESLYIEPHQGIKSGSPSKDQLRRALKGLEKAGLLEIRSLERKLVFFCGMVKQNYSESNKPAIKPHDEQATVNEDSIVDVARDLGELNQNDARAHSDKAATPLIKDNNYIFLLNHFEQFWEAYPLKKSKQKAWEAFQALNLNHSEITTLCSALQQQVQWAEQQSAQGNWVPSWKYPANWLSQHCWEDDIQTSITQETSHAGYKANPTKHTSTDSFWDACKSGVEEDSFDNIIEFEDYRATTQTH